MIDQLDNDAGALTKREFTFVSRMNECCIALAREDTREGAIATLAMKWNVEARQAEDWVAKAEDYMALGVMNNAEEAKALYHHRLNDIYALCMEHGVTDVIEQTTKPVKLDVTIKDEAGQEIRERQFTNSTITKIKPNALNPGAIALAMKAAREMAHITGGPGDPRIGTQINNLVMGNMPTAQETHRLTEAQLAASIGIEIIDAEVVETKEVGGQPVLPQPAKDSGQRGNAGDAGPDQVSATEAESDPE